MICILLDSIKEFGCVIGQFWNCYWGVVGLGAGLPVWLEKLEKLEKLGNGLFEGKWLGKLEKSINIMKVGLRKLDFGFWAESSF